MKGLNKKTRKLKNSLSTNNIVQFNMKQRERS